MATGAEQFRSFGEEFLKQYPKNDAGGFSGANEDLEATHLIGSYMEEVAEAEARMFQDSATMRFVG